MTHMQNRILAVAALTFIGAAACADERAITTKPIGEVAYGSNLIKSGTNLPRGRVNFTATATAGTTAAADTLVLRFAGLDSLTSGAYQIWVGNDSATKFAPLTGTMVITRVDTSLNAQGDPVFNTVVQTVPNVGQFRFGGPNKSFEYRVQRSTIAGLANTDSLNLVLFSIESGASGATPSSVRPLWARRSQAASNISGLRFGNFMPRLVEEYLFATSGTGVVPAIQTFSNNPRGRIEVRGEVFTVNDSNYYRPPQGYYYQAWGVRVDTLGQPVDTVSLGVKASPYPRRISFFDADMSVPDPVSMYVLATPCAPGAAICPVQQPVIVASQHRVSADSIPAATAAGGPWRHFAWTYVTLQNKAAPLDRMGASHVMSVNNPGSISRF